MTASARYALGIDVGGTHTDIELVAIEDDPSFRHKIASTPEDPARAVTDGTREILALSRIAPEQIVYFAHGTTVATNALVQGRTASTALVTTGGFRDVLEIRRQRQPHLYNLRVEKPAPPVPRNLRYEIGERHYLFGRDGVEPDPCEVETLAAALAAAGVEAVAVCFLHSYDDSAHERSVGTQLREALPGVFVCLSSDVAPEPHEYERTSTTAINACLGPVMSGYLARITTGARGNGLDVEPTILQSNGGVASANDAANLPARVLASGPAAGVMGALAVANAVGLSDVITFDVGGTTADVCLVERGTPLVASEREVAGYPIRFPMIDVHSVGAGGGSIAWIDSGGFMHIGPRSAGAAPGPAAYGRGGELPTVTDACLVLGHLSRHGLLAGRLPLDIDAARRAIESRIAEPLSTPVEDAAAGMLTLLNENMVQAVRVISVERGFDPRCFALVAFGGAGPMLAGALARELAIGTVLIPPSPGLLCAQGLLAADE
ncbi:MAG: hydantoinase/oxoprolinase family protein, partial [Thiotrichales bacterium]|nr:hydantoinase/oxoprolinase family protein [Thiotrichales bacterium]